MPLMVDGAMAKNWNNKQKTYEDFPVHEFARSELRGLTIPEDYQFFLQPEDLEAFRSAFSDPVDERRAVQWWKMADYVDDCVRALSEFDTDWLKFDMPARFIRCKTVMTMEHYRDPAAHIGKMEAILLAWADNKPIIYGAKANQNEDDQAYAAVMTLSDYASFYAVYYDQFRFDQEQRKAVETYLADWIINHDLDPESGRVACPLKAPQYFTRTGDAYRGDTDHCGSNRLRIAIAGVYLGLRLQDQKLFEAGSRHLEIALAVVDPEGIFIPWARKGKHALSYQRQLPEVLTLLALAYESVGYDFYEHRLPHGRRIHEVYAALFDFIQHPEKLTKYAAAEWYFAGGSFWDFDPLPLEEKWEDQMIYPRVLAAQAKGYVHRYRPDLQHLIDYETDWERHWKDHIAVFVSISGITVYEAAQGYADFLKAKQEAEARALEQEIAENRKRLAEQARKARERERREKEEAEKAFAQQVAANKARLADNARMIRERERKEKEAAALGFDRLMAAAGYLHAEGYHLVNSIGLEFVPSRVFERRNVRSPDEVLKLGINGKIQMVSEADEYVAAAARNIENFQNFRVLASLYEDKQTVLVGILARDLSAPFDIEARILSARAACGKMRKPPEWLVIPIRTKDREELALIDCYQRHFASAGEMELQFFDSLLLAAPAVEQYLRANMN